METPVAETPPAAEKPIAVDAAAPTPTQPRKSNWVDWALFAGGDTLAALGLLGYLGAINSVNQANAMDFSALNAEANYKSQVAQARSARTTSVIVGIVGVGLAGWGAWRLWGPVAATAPAKSTGWLMPTVAPDAAGLAWGGRF